jgi:hypothetical protein
MSAEIRIEKINMQIKNKKGKTLKIKKDLNKRITNCIKNHTSGGQKPWQGYEP